MFTFTQPEKTTKTSTTNKIAKSTKITKKYIKTAQTPEWFNGEQRRIIYTALFEQNGPFTANDLLPQVETMGLKSKTPIIESIAYHLHQLQILGFIEIAK